MATRKKTEQTARLKKFEDLALRLHAAASQLVRKSQASDRTSGLSTARLSALSTLVTTSPMTLRTLAQLEHVRPPTMTRIFQGLEREGLVRRMDDTTDRRRVFVIATPKGREVLEREQKRRVEPLALTIRCLHHTKLAQLTKVLRLLEELAADVRG